MDRRMLRLKLATRRPGDEAERRCMDVVREE